MTRTWTALLLAWLTAASWCAPALAQIGEKPRRYVRFQIDKNYVELLKKRLGMADKLEPLKDLVKKIIADPSKMPTDAAQLKDLKFEDEDFKQALKDWLENDPVLKQSLEEWIQRAAKEKNPENVKKLQDDLTKILNQDEPKRDKQVDAGRDEPSPRAVEQGEEENPETLAQLTERTMEELGTTKLGNWLRDSPAWKRAFLDLRTSVNNPDAMRWRDWQGRLGDKDSSWWKFGEGTIDRLRAMPKPDLDRWRLPGLKAISAPGVPGPGMPQFSGPSLPSLSTTAIWILFIAALMLVGWWLLRGTGGGKRKADARFALGPWPVRPEAVSTRAELILAFDYLAVLTLGPGARSWNHRAVARVWTEKARECTGSAHLLADLYEQARYTEGAASLTDSDCERARRSLSQLAEAL
ncbi:MAG: hypothetical protein HYX68_05810 [Planctomycetes bacterium]|nr:hypothetical protein [Planctomycetota bacterium]